jgi:hypothetical protein
LSEFRELIAGRDKTVRGLALQARELILHMVPEAREKVIPGWKIVWYSFDNTLRTLFCAIGPLKDRINIYFPQGAALPDPARLLEGSGKKMRHIKVRDERVLKSRAFKRLIKAAVKAVPKARPVPKDSSGQN